MQSDVAAQERNVGDDAPDFQLPDANGRVLDFLNEDTAFLTLFQEERILLVNKRRIVRVAELDKEEL